MELAKLNDLTRSPRLPSARPPSAAAGVKLPTRGSVQKVMANLDYYALGNDIRRLLRFIMLTLGRFFIKLSAPFREQTEQV